MTSYHLRIFPDFLGYYIYAELPDDFEIIRWWHEDLPEGEKPTPGKSFLLFAEVKSPPGDAKKRTFLSLRKRDSRLFPFVKIHAEYDEVMLAEPIGDRWDLSRTIPMFDGKFITGETP